MYEITELLHSIGNNQGEKLHRIKTFVVKYLTEVYYLEYINKVLKILTTSNSKQLG